MHGCMTRRLAWTLALTVTCGTSAARGQQYEAPVVPGPAGYAAAQAPVMQQVSAMEAADGNSKLASDVADLKKQLKEMKDKETAAKAKIPMSPQIGGMIQMDAAMFTQQGGSVADYNTAQNGFEFRRARLWVAGEGWNVIDYKIEMDFANLASGGLTYGTVGATQLPGYAKPIEQVDMKDCYITIKELPLLGNVRMGHFKEPFGLEQQTSDRFSTFMERSIADEGALVPARQNGVMAFNWMEGERATWAAGIFRTNCVAPPDFINWGNAGNMSVTGRITCLPWYDEATEGRGLLHIGLASSYRDMGTEVLAGGGVLNQFSMSARPEAHLAPKVVGLGLNTVLDYKLIGTELAYVYGPLSFQTEYYGAFMNLRNGGATDSYISGGYAYASYFLTGENRPYNKKAGCFDRVKPYENFFRVRDEDGCVQTGIGAWEVGYRYSWLDLNDGSNANAFQGGLAIDHTLGLNWYLNPNLRLMWNYVHSTDTPGASTPSSISVPGQTAKGYLDTFEMRAALDF